MSLLQALFGAKPPVGTPPFAPPHPQTGGANPIPAPGQAQRGISGFLDRALNPTNGLGQFGQMLVASQDNGLGRAMAGMIGQRSAHQEALAKQQAGQQRRVEHVGDKIGILDPVTGQFDVTYDAPDKPTGYGAELDAAGIVGDERAQLLRQYVTNRADPMASLQVPGGMYVGPRSGIPGALGVSRPAAPTLSGIDAEPTQEDGMTYTPGPGGRANKANWSMGGAEPAPANFPARAVNAVIGQESGGRVGIEGPQTQWGKAQGLMQVLPETAREMAAKLGVPYRPDLMTAKTPDAARYQQAIGEAYLQEGLAQTGNLRDAFRYYHGGPNRRQWGAKTNAYADSVLSRMGRSR